MIHISEDQKGSETDASEQQHGDGDNTQGGDTVQGDKVVVEQPSEDGESS